MSVLFLFPGFANRNKTKPNQNISQKQFLTSLLSIFSGSVQVYLPRNRRLRRPVPQQRRGIRVLSARQLAQ